ncbi:helix-turn-helix domain-containing protein [Candidatus Sumerlaeota bacterium]|nr:helix-turn-helix domain-containing protein [Candidatus Sumerlaeota bacterium]
MYPQPDSSPIQTLKKSRLRGPTQVNQSLRDGLEILLELAKWQRPVGSREIARVLEWDHARVHRFLTTLVDSGFAEQSSDRKYMAGPGLTVMATMALHNSRVFHSALPHLQELSSRTGYPVSLGVRWRRHVCYLYHGNVTDDLGMAIAPDNLYPAERSSIGLALLSRLHDEDIRKLYADQKKTSNAISIHELMDRIYQTRKQGYGMNVRFESVAVPLDETSETAISVYGLNEQLLQEKKALLVQELRRTASKIGQQIELY